MWELDFIYLLRKQVANVQTATGQMYYSSLGLSGKLL